MEIYVVLRWFYEGDSYLVDSFKGVTKTRKEAKSLLKSDDIILKRDDFRIWKGQKEPKEWGDYWSKT